MSEAVKEGRRRERREGGPLVCVLNICSLTHYLARPYLLTLS